MAEHKPVLLLDLLALSACCSIGTCHLFYTYTNWCILGSLTCNCICLCAWYLLFFKMKFTNWIQKNNSWTSCSAKFAFRNVFAAFTTCNFGNQNPCVAFGWWKFKWKHEVQNFTCKDLQYMVGWSSWIFTVDDIRCASWVHFTENCLEAFENILKTTLSGFGFSWFFAD